MSAPRPRPKSVLASLARLSVLACVAGAYFLLFAASAGAVVTEVEGVKVGLQPRVMGGATPTPGTVKPTEFANASGNRVLHGTSDYVVYWDPTDKMHHEWLTALNTFFHEMGEGGLTTPFGALGLYRDRSNAITAFQALFKGAYSDTVKFPAAGCTDPNPFSPGAVTCLTDAQLREQLQSFISGHSLPTGMGVVYDIVTPPGVTVCLDATASSCSDYKLTAKEEAEEHRESSSYKASFCSYHGAINPDAAEQGDAKTILYAAIPWTAGTAGLGLGEYFTPPSYSNAVDCQDGGWNPENHEENLEAKKALTKKEEEKFAEETPEKKKEIEEERALEGPHIEEPNQHGKGEFGDYGQALADILVNQVAVEEMNIVTDPLLTSWQDPAGNEVSDMCRNKFGSTVGLNGGEILGSVKADRNTRAGSLSNVTVGNGRYYINTIFNLAKANCVGGVSLVPRFTAPNPVNANEIVSLDGMESEVGLIKGFTFGASGPPTPTYATFTWNFGDGTEVTGFAPGAPPCEVPWQSPCAASALHTYQYGGTYKVVLTVTDVAGNRAAVEHQITVAGPARPSAPAAAGSSGVAPAAATSSPASSTPPPPPPPVAGAAVVSHSLRRAIHSGIVISYTVSEQVAGRIEVMLPTSLARRLGLAGPAAAGLPAGSQAQTVVGRAVLVTTGGGHSQAVIVLSKHNAKRLGRLRHVTMMLRLVVRNAARVPTSTSLLSAFTLR